MNNNPNKSNDSIDQWLSQSMNGFQADVPDHAWNDIANRLPNRRRKMLLFWYSLAGALFVGFILLFARFYGPNTINCDSSKILEVDQKIKSNVQQSQSEQEVDQIFLKQSSARKTNSEIEFNSKNGMTKHSVLKIKQSQFIKEKAMKLLVLDSLSPQKDLSITNNNANIFYEYKSLQVKLNALAIEWPKLELNILNQEKNNISAKQVKNVSNLWIGGQIGGFIVNRFNLNTETQKHSERIGVQSGIYLQLNFGNRWRFGTGVAYQQYHSTLHHNAMLRLQEGIPLNPKDPGLKNYAFNYEYKTPTGRSSVHIIMSEQDHASSMSLDEPFSLNMGTDQFVQSWILPMNIQRIFGKKKLQFSISTGALISYQSRITNTIVHYSELCQDLCFSSEKTPVFNTIPIKRFLLEGTLGVGLAYYLKPRIRVHISPEMSYGIHGFQKIGIQSGIFFNIK
ncbi:MAG: hypothetical protein IPO85_05195 [Saprospiraceae bacterium]|uniref:Outer membrane protein beta-barrel domain-containing protein n=1 Tax=Candidatus Defluviibacterium haderslevense TaxID=2981993 RepID=A0A9D7S820_9BACT|nr:hypothetical protein [Candidatus Defluviibacterium haderslevense]